jgi:hypothetical protein
MRRAVRLKSFGHVKANCFGNLPATATVPLCDFAIDPQFESGENTAFSDLF